MEIVGYNKNYDFTNHLNEATITCTYDELKEIASFIDDILKSANESNPTCCLHLRDFTKDWDKSSSDLRASLKTPFEKKQLCTTSISSTSLGVR
ncbi:MAG: hypothetical protein IJN43_13140 [Ruminococcus sp.]|nr:hypothetical protein [Ruminococcus sp.]